MKTLDDVVFYIRKDLKSITGALKSVVTGPLQKEDLSHWEERHFDAVILKSDAQAYFSSLEIKAETWKETAKGHKARIEKQKEEIQKLKAQIKSLTIADEMSKDPKIMREIQDSANKFHVKELKDEIQNLKQLLERYDLEKFARWLVKNGYCDTDVLPEGEDGVGEYLKEIINK